MLNKPATAREKIRVHLTVFIPADGITCFDGTVFTMPTVSPVRYGTVSAPTGSFATENN